MAAVDSLNNSWQLNITPSRKRKREFHNSKTEDISKATEAATSCFINAAFSSTPKKILAKRRILLNKNTENGKINQNVSLAVECSSEICEVSEGANKADTNPYEVAREPTKRRKRHTAETNCFVNFALNLEHPDKIFNPYEVVRDITLNKSNNCFSNPALNLKVHDSSVLCNPFEVQREAASCDVEKWHGKAEAHSGPLKPFVMSPQSDKQHGELSSKPTKFQLGLPFVPRVGCRVDFTDISMSQLTPTKLLAEKLVFSPVPQTKMSLASIGEESTMDIGKELDRYQLELENSINEAKLHKTGVNKHDNVLSPPDAVCQFKLLELKKNSKFSQKLCGISEENENAQIDEETTKTENDINVHAQNDRCIGKVEQSVHDSNNPFGCENHRTETAKVVEIENLDELYGCTIDDQEADESFDFRSPAAPFIRAYTKPNAPITRLKASESSLEYNIFDKSDKTDDRIKKSLNVKNIIRKSIRKLMHPQQQQETKARGDSAENEKADGFITTIRKSLRRKPAKDLYELSATKENEISIVDITERTIKLKSDLVQTEYIKIEDLTNERKHNLRNSIRKSTREVRSHFLKSISYVKHEKYDCNK